MASNKTLVIESLIGGGGDIWMRLNGLYVAAGLKPELKVEILIPGFLRNLAAFTFGDRLTILNSCDNPHLIYTVSGFRHLLLGILKGKKYISPYQLAVIKDKKKKQLKDVFNKVVFKFSDFLGLIQIPPEHNILEYQSYLEITSIKQLRQIDYGSFKAQFEIDYPAIQTKLHGKIPLSPQFEVPEAFDDKILVFPTGTSRQFIPVNWAKQYLPNAFYAFFHKDESLVEFKTAGLKTVLFYKEPGDIMALSKAAKWTISTDSFPSHLLQSFTKDCTITITEVLKSRIISPMFSGKVVDAVVPCHPCLHLDRKTHAKCSAGYTECLNWSNKIYTQNILKSIPAN